MTNAKIFTTQQLSKLWLISKRFPKELVTTKMNNILEFQQNPLTINRLVFCTFAENPIPEI